MNNLIYLDSHAHVFSDDFDEDRMEMIQRAKDKGVILLNIMCTSTEEAYRAMEYAEKDPAHIKVSCGIFPTDVNELTPEKKQEFISVMKDPRKTARAVHRTDSSGQ